MLEKLFGSKSRVKLLKIFLSQEDGKFYIRQLARDLQLQLNSVRRELENLEDFGLLTSAPVDPEDIIEEEIVIQTPEDIKRAKQRKSKPKEIKIEKHDKKYFRVNKNFVLYEEVKALVIKAQILYEKDFVKKLQKTGSPKLLILAGFFVGEPEKGVDILLVGRLNKNKVIRLIKSLEDELGREINYVILGAQEFKYRRDITDVFLYGILEGKRLIVIDELELS